MRAESHVQALLCCARVALTAEQRATLEALSLRGPELHALAALAEAHGVTPLLARHLDALGTACSAELRAQVMASAQRSAARSLASASELVRLLRQLGEAGVPALALKGPVSASLCFGDLGLRTFSDLDLLVRPADAGRALDVLEQSGYVPHMPLSPWARSRVVQVDSELLLRHRDDERLVDVHWALLPRGYSFSPDERGPFAARDEVRIGGASVPTLGLEATLLFLLLHGIKHDWASLGWLCDVAELTRRRSLDWDAVLSWSSARGPRRLIDVGLALAERLLDAEVPHAVLQRGRNDHAVGAAVDELERRLLAPSPPASVATGPFGLLYFALMERLTDRARFVHDMLLRPTAHEWRALPLPPALAPFYYAVRPLRLTWKHAGAWARRVKH